jgi:hypothetical protein
MANGRVPPPTPNTGNPFQIATLPANSQLQPDLVDQKYPAGTIPTMRVLPVVASGNPQVNAAAKSVVIQETPSTPTFVGENGITVSGEDISAYQFATAGQGGFWSAGKEMESHFGAGITSGILQVTGVNQILLWQFNLDVQYVLRSMTLNVVTAQSGQSFGFGLFSSPSSITGSANLLYQTGAIDASATGLQIVSVPSVVLPPGTYFFAACATSTGITCTAFEGNSPIMTNMLNLAGGFSGGNGPTGADANNSNLGTGTTQTVSVTPAQPNDFIFAATNNYEASTPAGWSSPGSGLYTTQASGSGPVTFSTNATGIGAPSNEWANVIASFAVNGVPTVVQSISFGSGGIGSGPHTATYGSNAVAGQASVVLFCSNTPGSAGYSNITVSDSQGNNYQVFQIGQNFDGTYIVGAFLAVALGVQSGPLSVTITLPTSIGGGLGQGYLYSGLAGTGNYGVYKNAFAAEPSVASVMPNSLNPANFGNQSVNENNMPAVFWGV